VSSPIVQILMVEDEEAHAELVRRAFERSSQSTSVSVVGSIRESAEAIARVRPDVVLADLRLPDGSGTELLPSAGSGGFPVVIMTSHGDERVAVEAMKAGAIDYVVKSEETFAQMPVIVARALNGWRLIQERHKAEETLREREEQFRSLIENALDLISVVGIDGRFQYLSPACLPVFGHAAEELLGVPLVDRVHDEDRPEVARFLEQLFQQPQLPRSLVFRARAQDGSWRVLETVGRARPGGAFAAVLNSRDVTERRRAEDAARRLEAQLRQAQKLETLGTLAGGIAHDFNNLLQAIQGCSELARGAASREQANVFLDRMLEATARGRQIVRQILAFGRRTEPEWRPILIGPVLHEAARLVKATFPTNVEVRCEVRSDATVLVDATQIHQVIINLCTNAQHAMEVDGGTLTLELERIQVGAAGPLESVGVPPGAYVRLRVSDTGHGMSDAVKQRLFEPFFTTKGVGEGTGLGLAVAHGIVTGHGGVIQVDSSPGQGASFAVLLPEAEDTVGAAATPSLAADLRGKRVLCLDDQAVIAETLRELLEARGARVLAVTAAAEAVAAVRAAPHGFDVAIVDHTMPQHTGMAVIEELRTLAPDLPVVLISGYGEAISAARLRALGVAGYLPKPFGTQDLLRVLAEVL
jgi:PAS domain S-box-containing protein